MSNNDLEKEAVMKLTMLCTVFILCFVTSSALGVTKENVSSSTLYNEHPDIWIDASNGSHMVYLEKNENGEWEIYYRYRASNGLYGSKIQIPVQTSKNFRQLFFAPKIAVDSSGVVHVVYIDCQDTQNAEYARVMYIRKSGSVWSSPIQISLDANELTPHSRCPDIFVDPATDDVHVAWDQHPPDHEDGTLHCVYWCVWKSGEAGFENGRCLTDIQDEGTLLSWAPRIIVDANHAVHLAYMKQDFVSQGGTYRQIWYTRADYNSLTCDWDWDDQQDHEIVEDEELPVGAYYPSITLHNGVSSIIPYITFVRQDSSGIDQVYSYKSSGSWVTPVAVNSSDVLIILCEIEVTTSYVYVTMNQDNGDDESKIYLKRFNRSNDTFSSTIDVLDTQYMSWTARLGKTSVGTWHVAWDDRQWLLDNPPVEFSNAFFSYPD